MKLNNRIDGFFYKNGEGKLDFRFIETGIKVGLQSEIKRFLDGSEISEKQKNSSWGDGFLKQLSKDLSYEFPDIKGFSLRNLKYISQWYRFYMTDLEIGQQVQTDVVNEIIKDAVNQLSEKFKNYAWERNFGYGTKAHMEGLKKFGITSHHRKGFKPIHKMLSS